MEKEVIEVPSKGRVILNLYGKDIEIDESMFENGVATLKKFGKIYEIQKKSRKKSNTTTEKREEEKTVVEVLQESQDSESE